MTDRRIDRLDELAPEPAPPSAPPAALPEPPAVELNYPDPTPLSLVIKDVARWSKLCFVMEPTVNVKIQIFAPRKLRASEAYDLFLASLSVVGLRAVQVGSVVKVVPVTHGVAA